MLHTLFCNTCLIASIIRCKQYKYVKVAFYILAVNKKQNSKKKKRNKMEIQNLNSLLNTVTNYYYLHKKNCGFFFLVKIVQKLLL